MFGKQTLPGCEKLTGRIIAIPVHHGLKESQIRNVAETIKSAPKKIESLKAA